MELFAYCEIDRPADEVFAFVSDACNNPLWQKGQQSCEWTSPPPIGPGSTYEQKARFLGRTIISRFTVIEHEPGRVIAIESTEGPFPITVRRSVEPLGPARSRVAAEIAGEPGGFFRLAGPLLRGVAQRSVNADYRRLKRLLEDS